MKINGTGPIIGLDIDGTLGDYHSHFIKFAEAWTGRAMPEASEINPGQRLRSHLGMGGTTYRACKLAFRQGGMKRSMPCYPGAARLAAGLRRNGSEVWICTSRPYNQMGSVDTDTRHWLRRHRIQYDNIIWGERKYKDLARVAPGRVVAVLDDLPEMYAQAVASGLAAYLRTQPYNTFYNGLEVRRLDNLAEAEWILNMELYLWKKDKK